VTPTASGRSERYRLAARATALSTAGAVVHRSRARTPGLLDVDEPGRVTIFDGSHLVAVSADLQAVAQELDHQRVLLRSGAAELPWHSPGARAFAGSLEVVLTQVHSTVQRVQGLSGALRRHAETAENRAEVLDTAVALAERPVQAIGHLIGFG
jgi:hypothetical protein